MKSRRKKILKGIVVSDKMEKTLVVKVIREKRHPKYMKLVKTSKKYYVHDDTKKAKVGMNVKIIQSRPLSKLKRWRLLEVL